MRGDGTRRILLSAVPKPKARDIQQVSHTVKLASKGSSQQSFSGQELAYYTDPFQENRYGSISFMSFSGQELAYYTDPFQENRYGSISFM